MCVGATGLLGCHRRPFGECCSLRHHCCRVYVTPAHAASPATVPQRCPPTQVIERTRTNDAALDTLRARVATAEARLAVAVAAADFARLTAAPAPTATPHPHVKMVHSPRGDTACEPRIVNRVYAPIEVQPGSMLSIFA